MLDHIGITVSDYETSKKFYQQALAPLGYVLLMEVEGFAGFGVEKSTGPIATFWLHQCDASSSTTHIAFSAANRKMVDQFYQTAIKAGGKDNGSPGIREMYHPTYYGTFVFDPDGYNIEAVCHKKL